MTPLAAAANAAWLGSSLRGWKRFRAALRDPEKAQALVLRHQLATNRECAYGRAYQFARIGTYSEFVRRIPVTTYEDLEPWIHRVARGEPAVLTSEKVTRLMPTSGSTGARKLIPFTAGLQREFNAAIGPWIVDLARQHPGVAFGPAYWSITPALTAQASEPSTVPIGFEEDSAYLGQTRSRMIDAMMAVPSALRHVSDLAAFRRLVLLFLLRSTDLRLISVWHPSFLSLLIDTLPSLWDELLGDIQRGGYLAIERVPESLRETVKKLPALPERAAQLRTMGPHDASRLWPALRVISCWADANAHFGYEELRARFPGVAIQPKGLLSTEAFVTVPFASEYPATVTSHFFEFIGAAGNIARVEQVERGQVYEVVVTTSGGLWRYRTGDYVEVTGFVYHTPSFRFVGRGRRVSDLFGEKLSEAFVADALPKIFAGSGSRPRFAMLAPERDSIGRWHYTLFFAGYAPSDLAQRLDLALRGNPHYAYCRDLGQLHAPQLFVIDGSGYDQFVAVELKAGVRLGDIKPVALSLRTDWSTHFQRDPRTV